MAIKTENSQYLFTTLKTMLEAQKNPVSPYRLKANVRFLVVDTETATFPCYEEVAKNEKEKKELSVNFAINYDIGWVITTINGINLKRRYLVEEVYSDEALFQTAFYKEKRTIYEDLLKKGMTEIKPWSEIEQIFLDDLASCDFFCAYNAAFDARSIRRTSRYAHARLAQNFSYESFEENMKEQMEEFLSKTESERIATRDPLMFTFCGVSKPIIDIWAMSTEYLINNSAYKLLCMQNDWYGESKRYFSTTAEYSYRYMTGNYGFVEEHTALEDAVIEAEMLVKLFKRNRLILGYAQSPHETLGKVCDFVEQQQTKKGCRKIAVEDMKRIANSLKCREDCLVANGGNPYTINRLHTERTAIEMFI